jgi:outer membrane immunogenic protein
MRTLLAAAVTSFLIPAAALAADLDFGSLRGSDYDSSDLSPVADWSGVYIGGLAGSTQANFQNKSGTRDLLDSIFRNSTLQNEYDITNLLQFKSKSATGGTYGGFAGYNYQMDEVVLGVEADYTSMRLRGSSTDTLSRRMGTSDGSTHDVYLSGTTGAELRDLWTVRGRAGVTWGSLMPFVTGGLAVGQIRTTDSATARWRENYANGDVGCGTPACGLQTLTRSKDNVAAGYTVGAGLEFMLTRNVFLRGEYQYAYLNDFSGHKLGINTVRGGAGVKF